MRFNPPPGWPTPPSGWLPPAGWRPDPSWPEPPPGWQLLVDDPQPSAPDAAPDPELAAVPEPAPAVATTPVADTERATAPHAPSAPESDPTATTSPAGATETPRSHADAGADIDLTTSAAPAATVDPVRDDVVAVLAARVVDLEAQLARAHAGTAAAEARTTGHAPDTRGVGSTPAELDDAAALQDLGIYRYHHPLENAAAYKDRLKNLEGRITTMAKAGDAVLAADLFTWNGSLAQGKTLVRDLSKLMLRAYNAEADNAVRALRSGNVATAKKRLETSAAAVAKLGRMMELQINPAYHALRLEEVELVADYQMKVQAEREEAREQRELLREQRRAEAELAAERERLDKERAHYLTVLESLRAKGDQASADELAGRLEDIEQAIEDADYRAANIRAGYVYVISNVGAFGGHVVKIGMTRRLEPYDRIRELGDASVPFTYDVHALFFSEDAITLENELHKAFAHRRLNQVNHRREFFFATPHEVLTVLQEKVGGLLEYHEEPEALEFNQSLSSWPTDLELRPRPGLPTSAHEKASS